MKEWYSAKELAGITGLPNHPTNVTRLAKKQNWLSRVMNGTKGGGKEFSFNCLPPEAQQALKLQEAQRLVAEMQLNVQPKQESNPVLWNEFNAATGAKKEQAEIKFRAVVALEEALLLNIPILLALEQTAR